MTIAKHIEAAKERLSNLERAVEKAPERMFETAHKVASAVGVSSKASASTSTVLGAKRFSPI